MFRAGVKSMKDTWRTLTKYQLDEYTKYNCDNFKNDFKSDISKQMFIEEVRANFWIIRTILITSLH